MSRLLALVVCLAAAGALAGAKPRIAIQTFKGPKAAAAQEGEQKSEPAAEAQGPPPEQAAAAAEGTEGEQKSESASDADASDENAAAPAEAAAEGGSS